MNYLILGANAAGMSAAMRIHKYDPTAQITVLEKTAVVSFGACGLPYFVGGEFTDIETMTARPMADFMQLGFDIRLHHEAVVLDADQRQVTAYNSSTGESVVFDYERLMIAVGASPLNPSVPGSEANPVHTMHSKQDACELLALLPQCRRVVIIGAGFIGLEAAEAFSARGKQVTLLEFGQRAVARSFDPEITSHLEAALQRHDVQLCFNEEVLEIKSCAGVVSAVLTNVGQYPADLVLIVAGVKPNTHFLAGSAVELNAHGAIVIDDQCRTSVADIYAAGDCATVPHQISGDVYLPLATTANKMGRIAGEVMAGKDSRFIGTLGSCAIRVFDVEAGRTGITEADAGQLGLNYATVLIEDKNHTAYVPGQSALWIKLIFDRDSRKLLGGQLCGTFGAGAVLRVNALAVAVYSGLTVDELGMMDFIYAPPFARTWDALNVAGNVAAGVLGPFAQTGSQRGD